MLVLDVNFFSLGIEIDFGDMIKIILCNLMIFILKKEIVIINYDFQEIVIINVYEGEGFKVKNN